MVKRNTTETTLPANMGDRSTHKKVDKPRFGKDPYKWVMNEGQKSTLKSLVKRVRFEDDRGRTRDRNDRHDRDRRRNNDNRSERRHEERPDSRYKSTKSDDRKYDRHRDISREREQNEKQHASRVSKEIRNETQSKHETSQNLPQNSKNTNTELKATSNKDFMRTYKIPKKSSIREEKDRVEMISTRIDKPKSEDNHKKDTKRKVSETITSSKIKEQENSKKIRLDSETDSSSKREEKPSSDKDKSKSESKSSTVSTEVIQKSTTNSILKPQAKSSSEDKHDKNTPDRNQLDQTTLDVTEQPSPLESQQTEKEKLDSNSNVIPSNNDTKEKRKITIQKYFETKSQKAKEITKEPSKSSDEIEIVGTQDPIKTKTLSKAAKRRNRRKANMIKRLENNQKVMGQDLKPKRRKGEKLCPQCGKKFSIIPAYRKRIFNQHVKLCGRSDVCVEISDEEVTVISEESDPEDPMIPDVVSIKDRINAQNNQKEFSQLYNDGSHKLDRDRKAPDLMYFSQNMIIQEAKYRQKEYREFTSNLRKRFRSYKVDSVAQFERNLEKCQNNRQIADLYKTVVEVFSGHIFAQSVYLARDTLCNK